MLNFTEDGSWITAAIGAVTSLFAVVFGFILKSKKASIRHVEESWEELIQDSASFRDEIRRDLLMVKEERGVLQKNLILLEQKLQKIIEENLELKHKELELTHQVKYLKGQLIKGVENGEA